MLYPLSYEGGVLENAGQSTYLDSPMWACKGYVTSRSVAGIALVRVRCHPACDVSRPTIQE